MKRFQKNIQTIFRAFAVILSVTFSLSAAHAEEKKVYEVQAIEHLRNSYNSMIEGKDIFDYDSWKEMDLERHTLEMLIFNVAPIVGGCNCEILIKPYAELTPHSRSIAQVQMGELVSHPITIFEGDSRITDDLYTSDPILNADEFFVGLYTHESRAEVLNKTTEEEIRKLNFIAGHDWEIDNKILDHFGLTHIMADDWASVIFMLIDGRADVVMQPFFASEDFGFDEEQGTEHFIPIPGVKMPFPHGRVYFVSKKHPDGAEFITYLNKGIEELRANGDLLRRAHEWAGVINERTNDFEIVFNED